MHDQISKHYLEAINRFSSRKVDPHATDTMLRGIDRELNHRIEEVSADIERFHSSNLAVEAEQADASHQLHLVVTIALGVMLAVSIATLLTMARMSVFRRVGGDPVEVAGIVKDVAAGDLSHSLTHEPGARGLLAEVLGMSSNLRKVLIDLHASASNLSSTSFHLADSANDMASTVNDQNEAVRKMQRLTVQLNQSIQQIATNSSDAQQIANASSDIGQLGDKSRSISAVVSSIRDIADQTIC